MGEEIVYRQGQALPGLVSRGNTKDFGSGPARRDPPDSCYAIGNRADTAGENRCPTEQRGKTPYGRTPAQRGYDIHRSEAVSLYATIRTRYSRTRGRQSHEG